MNEEHIPLPDRCLCGHYTWQHMVMERSTAVGVILDIHGCTVCLCGEYQNE